MFAVADFSHHAQFENSGMIFGAVSSMVLYVALYLLITMSPKLTTAFKPNALLCVAACMFSLPASA